MEYVSFFAATRFANWINNGQGGADMDSGSYTITGTPQYYEDETLRRNVGPGVFIPTDDELYKAYFYDEATASYFTSSQLGGSLCDWLESPQPIEFARYCRGSASSDREPTSQWSGDVGVGFRLSMIPVPEPSTGLLVFAGLLGLAGWRRARA